MKKLSKTEANEAIEKFFKEIKDKTPKEIRKVKKLAMSHNIKLAGKRKLFCRKCLMPYSGKEKIRVKDKIKSITCGKCGSISRWKLK